VITCQGGVNRTGELKKAIFRHHQLAFVRYMSLHQNVECDELRLQ